MKNLVGLLISLAGFALLAIAAVKDTTVYVAELGVYVHNVGLVSQRNSMMIFGMALIILGGIVGMFEINGGNEPAQITFTKSESPPE